MNPAASGKHKKSEVSEEEFIKEINSSEGVLRDCGVLLQLMGTASTPCISPWLHWSTSQSQWGEKSEQGDTFSWGSGNIFQCHLGL